MPSHDRTSSKKAKGQRPKYEGQKAKKMEAFDQSLSEMLEDILHEKFFFLQFFSKNDIMNPHKLT